MYTLNPIAKNNVTDSSDNSHSLNGAGTTIAPVGTSVVCNMIIVC